MNIFDYIENKSYKIADIIGKGEDEDKIELYRYSVFAILSQIFTLGTGLLVSYILGVFWGYILVFLFFAMMRRGSGGYHCKSFRGCFFFSNTEFILGACLVFLLQDYAAIFALATIPLVFSIIPLCPKPSENSPSRGLKEDIRFRKLYRNAIILLSLLSIMSIFFVPIISTAISMAMVSTFCSVVIYPKIFEKPFNK